jgi:hypothetical protein
MGGARCDGSEVKKRRGAGFVGRMAGRATVTRPSACVTVILVWPGWHGYNVAYCNSEGKEIFVRDKDKGGFYRRKQRKRSKRVWEVLALTTLLGILLSCSIQADYGKFI